MATHLNLTQTQEAEDSMRNLPEILRWLATKNKVEKTDSEEIKIAMGKNYLPKSFKGMVEHLKKIL